MCDRVRDRDEGAALIGQRAGLQIRRIRSQPHCPADRVDTEQIAQFINDGVWRVRIELGAVGVFQSANILRVLDDGALHPETNAEIRNLLFARELDRANHSGNAALAEAPWNQDSVELTKVDRFAFRFQTLGFDPMNPGAQIVDEAAMDQRFAEALVRILQFHVFADDADRYVVDRVIHTLDERFPVLHLAFGLR